MESLEKVYLNGVILKKEYDDVKARLEAIYNVSNMYDVDIVILMIAIKNGAWFKTDYYGLDITFHKLFNSEIDLEKNRFDIRKENLVKDKEYYTGGFIFDFKDYGITWSLRKEVLEDARIK